jgi:hypothetical protein
MPVELLFPGFVIVISLLNTLWFLSRCRIDDKALTVMKDFFEIGTNPQMRIQKNHVIRFDEVDRCSTEILEKGMNTAHEDLQSIWPGIEQFLVYGGRVRNIRFDMKDGTVCGLIVNRYSRRQIHGIFAILRERIPSAAGLADKRPFRDR